MFWSATFPFGRFANIGRKFLNWLILWKAARAIISAELLICKSSETQKSGLFRKKITLLIWVISKPDILDQAVCMDHLWWCKHSYIHLFLKENLVTQLSEVKSYTYQTWNIRLSTYSQLAIHAMLHFQETNTNFNSVLFGNNRNVNWIKNLCSFA